jgi:hypothetical protein
VWAGAFATPTAAGGGVFAIWISAGLNAVLSVVAVLGLVTTVLYGRDVLGIFKSRKRRQLELNTRMAVLSYVSLAATSLLGLMLVLSSAFAAQVGAFAFLAIFGWLSGLVLAKLYKIVAFLTWLETYGPVMGRAPTPRVQDLVSEARASKWFVIYHAAVWFGTVMLLIGQATAFRAAAAMMTVGIVGIIREIVRTRRLADVESPMRLPDGACAPHLLFARN